jgi:uncharacterized protein YdeI (YjbR/CyaY-like superfamily)
MTTTATVEKLSTGMHGVLLPDALAQHFLARNQKRVLCIINGAHTQHSALTPIKGMGHCITIGMKVLKALKVTPGETLSIELRDDDSAHQFELPEALDAVLETDPEAREVFDRLTPGNRRSLMALVVAVKSTDKRIERALTIADALKRGITRAQEVARHRI